MIMAGVITDKGNLCNGSKCPIDTYIYTRSTMGFSECVSSYKHTQDGLVIKYSKNSNTFLCLPLTSFHVIKHKLKIVLFKNNYLDQNDCRKLGNLGPVVLSVEKQTALYLFPAWGNTHTHTYTLGGTPLERGAEKST
jgi:hypothetical protein